jgi:hypothetical protein
VKYEGAQGKACLASDFKEMEFYGIVPVQTSRSKTTGECGILQLFG